VKTEVFSVTKEIANGKTGPPGEPDSYVWKSFLTDCEDLRVIHIFHGNAVHVTSYNPFEEDFPHALNRAINEEKLFETARQEH
jgi:hypothetical protein